MDTFSDFRVLAQHPHNMKPNLHKVGACIHVSMHGGKIVDAVIKAIIDKTDGLHYQIDFGNEQTALISERQVVKD
jgi:hypothetical protein